MRLTAFALSLFTLGSLRASLVTQVQANGQYFDQFAAPFSCSDSHTGQTIATGGCSIDAPSNAFHYAFGTYTATAQYGRLDTYSRSSTYIGGELQGTSTASFTDTFTVTGGMGSAMMVFSVEFWGTVGGDNCGVGLLCFENSVISFGGKQFHPGPHPASGPQTTDFAYQFTFGVPFVVTASMSSYSTTIGHEIEEISSHFQVDSIRLRNASGNSIGGVVTAESGTVYQLADAPEPATFVLLFVPVVAMICSRRRSFEQQIKP